MSTIRVVYLGEAPNFPATDQHPDAVRYQVGECWVDAIGGAPTQAEVDAFLSPAAAKPELETLKERIAVLEGQVAAAKAP